MRDRKPREATASDIFTKKAFWVETMQVAVVLTADAVPLTCPLEMRVLLRQTTLDAVLETFFTHVTETRLAQQ